MESVSQYSQLGVSVNATGSLQTSTVSSQVTPRTSHTNINSSPNITFAQTPNVAQIVFQQNAKHDEMQTKYLTTTVQPQPLIIGNVNATNFLTAALANRRDNTMVLPSNLTGLSSVVNSNSLIGIVPVFVQQGANGLWFQPSNRPGEDKSSSVIIPQDVGGYVSVCSIGDVRPTENATMSQGRVPPPPVKITSTTDLQPGLSSSDTIILHSLASQDTIKIPSQSINSRPEFTIPQQHLSSMNLNSSFSLISNVSERSVSLTSIPTTSLFSPEQNELKNVENTPVPCASIVNNDNVSSNQPASNSKAVCDDLSQSHCATPGVEPEKSSKRRERMSESEPCQLQIDESADTDISDAEMKDSEASENKTNNLTRSDTVILAEEPPISKESIPAVSNSDTVILQDAEELERNKSRSSHGFNTHSVHVQSAESSVEIYGTVPASGNPNTALSSQDKQNSSIKLDSFQSMPNLVLTDSMVNGSFDSNLLCGLLSQTGIIQQPSFFTNMAPDQMEARNLTELTPIQSASGMPTIQVSLPKSSLGVEANVTDASCSNNSSAKGTQTDWVFGNASICFKPVTRLEEEHAINKDSKSVVESSAEAGNIPSSVILAEDNEDITNGPIILDEQAVPASILNLIPPDVTLFNSTANMSETDSICTTSVQNSRFTTSKTLFPCTNCDQAFLTKRELDKHMKEHRKVLKCDLCTSTFTRMGNYTRHRKIHNLQPESQNVYTCECCNREFLQRCDLRRHMLIHTKQEPHRCDICGKGYIRRSDLVVHLRFHKKEKAFKCTICDKSFFQSGDLGRHIRRTHKPNSQLTCGHCDRKYACETTLIRHMKVVHKDIILKTVKRLQGTNSSSEDQPNPNSQDLMFAMNDGNRNQEKNSQSS